MSNLRLEPHWLTIKPVLTPDLTDFDPRILFASARIENAILFHSLRPLWRPEYDEYAYLVAPGYWIMARATENKEQQHKWRQERYAEPQVVATFAAFRSGAEKAQIRKLEIDKFKEAHGLHTRPSKKGKDKPVVDENYIKDLLKQGHSVRDICKEFDVVRALVARWALEVQKHLRQV